MTKLPARQHTGIPTGGQFATTVREPADMGDVQMYQLAPDVIMLTDNGEHPPLTARVVLPGENYGLFDEKTNDLSEPIVSFYDARSQQAPNGQHISDMPVSELVNSDESTDLDLHGRVLVGWKITPANVDAAIDFASKRASKKAAMEATAELEKPCVCTHSRDAHDEQGRCDECDCRGFVPEPAKPPTGLPRYAQDYTPAQRKATVDYLATLPLKELRARQRATETETSAAFEKATYTRFPRRKRTEPDPKFEAELIDLQRKGDQITDAIYISQFGEKP